MAIATLARKRSTRKGVRSLRLRDVCTDRFAHSIDSHSALEANSVMGAQGSNPLISDPERCSATEVSRSEHILLVLFEAEGSVIRVVSGWPTAATAGYA